MNFKATASSIAASGGIRPDSHITARPVTAIKAGSVALTLTGQRSYRMSGSEAGLRPATSRSGVQRLKPCEELQSSRVGHNLGNPCAEKVRPHRSRQNNRCAHRSVRHHERPLPWKASRLRDSSAGFCLAEPMGLRSGGSEAWQGTLTITGYNVRLGTEMPVALSSFSV